MGLPGGADFVLPGPDFLAGVSALQAGDAEIDQEVAGRAIGHLRDRAGERIVRLNARRSRRGATAAAGRMQVMLGCAVLLPLSPLIASTAGLSGSLAVSTAMVAAALAWLINLSALVVDLVPRHSLGAVFGVVAAGSTTGGLIMNTLVAAMVTESAAAPAGFLDRAIHIVLGPLLSTVQGQGYGRWFLLMAFLHPVAWLLLRVGKISRAAAR